MYGFTDSIDQAEVADAKEELVDPRIDLVAKLKDLNVEFAEDEDTESLLAKYQEATKKTDASLTDDDKTDLLD